MRKYKGLFVSVSMAAMLMTSGTVLPKRQKLPKLSLKLHLRQKQLLRVHQKKQLWNLKHRQQKKS